MEGYILNDIHKLFNGSDQLHMMERELKRFREIIRGIILSKKFRIGTILVNHTDSISNQFSIQMLIHAPKNKLGINFEIIYITKKYGNKSLPKKVIPLLYQSMPQILTILVKNKPELKEDIEFLMSMAPNILG
ncbi:hypothetical protein KJ603_00400 [Patescibacteria group bacterium]|nr:hypothetical protein [Patescibacteria group bacterium]